MMRFGMFLGAVLALAVSSPAIADECPAGQSAVVIGLTAGPDSDVQVRTFCRPEKPAIIMTYKIGGVSGFADCEVVEFIDFHLRCGGKTVAEDRAWTYKSTMMIGFARDGKQGPDRNRALNSAGRIGIPADAWK